MLFDGTRQEADAILAAMKVVASAGGTEALTDADRTALSTADRVVFRADEPLDIDALGAIEPAQLAAAVDDDANAEHATAFLTVMALVDGDLDVAKVDLVKQFTDALGHDEAYVDDVVATAKGNLDEARADMVRRNLKSISGRWLDVDEDAWLLPYRDHPDPDLHARYATLDDLPERSFGGAFARFYLKNGFDYPGVPNAANETFTTPHDSAHVLSGYDTSPEGELLVSTFTAGMHRDEPVAGHILPVIFSWHLGIELVKFAGSITGQLHPEKFWVAWSRGAELTQDTFAPDWDFWAHAHADLDTVRAAMSVPPLDPAHAADGHYPDWYTPSA